MIYRLHANVRMIPQNFGDSDTHSEVAGYVLDSSCHSIRVALYSTALRSNVRNTIEYRTVGR